MLAITDFSKQAVAWGPENGSARESSDEALIRAIADGDKQAMQVLYARHYVRVYRFIVRLIDDAALAEDLVSEVFIAVWRRADGFKSKSQVSTWLLAIARNKALSARCRRRDEQLDDEFASSIVAPGHDPEAMICHRDQSAVIRKCLLQLSNGHREVIDLVYYHEKSVEEVAQIIHVPAATVKTRMFYARKCLEKVLTASGYGLH
jgi:RNA polymerase sigma-70 factor (ECF subfamily)